MLLTEYRARWLRDDAAARGEAAAAEYGLWWPPTKIAGLWLGRYLLERDIHAAGDSPRGGLPIEVRIDRHAQELDAHTSTEHAGR